MKPSNDLLHVVGYDGGLSASGAPPAKQRARKRMLATVASLPHRSSER
jgi:hypothetical protein